jgi:CRP/FNR family transcriptional regulator
MLVNHPLPTSLSMPSSSARPSSGTLAWSSQPKLWSSLKELCELLKIATSVGNDDFQFQHMQFRAGQRIHTIGQPFDMLYVVNSGFLKNVMIDELGTEQVLGFPMKGDMFGIDGIHHKQYSTETVALGSCDVILVPFKIFASLARNNTELEAAFYYLMSRELARKQGMISTLGALSAEARVARFLVFMSERFTEMGYSGSQFNLRMTRQEIGNYLGLTLETVSRTFSAFGATGLISVDQRAIKIHELQSLRTLRRLPPSRNRVRAKAVD